MDPWIVSHRFDGSTTRSWRPAWTDGAFVFSRSSSGISASSPRQSPPVPVMYSQPRATGGGGGPLAREGAGGRAEGRRGNPGGEPPPLRGGARAGGVGVVL